MSYATLWPLFSPSHKIPFKPAPRYHKGNMCGVRVPGLPPVDGGAPDASLVLSWFYDRYNEADRTRIRAAWKARGLTTVYLSWPDSRAVGATPEAFTQTVRELVLDGFDPCAFWCSKDFDPADVPAILESSAEVRARCVGLLPLACIGWELSLWLTPTQVQQLIDAMAPPLVAYGCRVYVHFQQGYGSFQQDGGIFADFWKLQVGKLTGLLHQKVLSQDLHAYRYDSGGLYDILARFAGQAFCPPDSGFGHPFDLVAYEITAMTQFDGSTSERQGDALGTWAVDTPAVMGPLGPVFVQGSGNGCM